MPEYVRVRDKDTGYHSTVPKDGLHLGNYQVLKQDATDLNGEPLPVDYTPGSTDTSTDTTKKGDS